MVRISRLTIPSLVCAAACAAACSSSSKPDPGGDPQPGGPKGPGTVSPGTSNERPEVSLGMTILARDAAGAPRLMRALRPRAMPSAMTAPLAARDHLAALTPLWIDRAHPMALTETGTQALRNDAHVVRLAQKVGDVVVDGGEIRVLMYADGSLAAVSGTVLPDMAPPSFVSSPSAMLDRALDRQFGSLRTRPAVTAIGEQSGWQKLEVAPDPVVRVTEARARRVIARDGAALAAGWELEVFGEAAPDPLRDPTIPAPTARRYVLADGGGQVLSESDLMQNDAFVYRAYAETTGHHRPLDGPLTDFSPHPTGFPDGSAPTGIVDAELSVMEAFNAPRDKWLPDDATTTSGNNVNAFGDLDGNNVFSTGDVRPQIQPKSRIFNYHYDTTLEPLATPDQIKAGVVNLFFLNNWMHDWWYDSGFTEATGNAQVNNLMRGGVGGDPITALAQAGANNGARDNATMATPADGASPRMRIFLFSTSTVVALTTPAGSPHAEGFSAQPHKFELTGSVAIADDGAAPVNDACQSIKSDVAGKIALITFSGVCGSAATVNNAKAAGAIGVILADGALEDPRAFAGSAAANLPGLAIGKTDGETLAAAVAAGPVTVALSSAPFGVERDGDLDSGVSGHEWAHYLHHRLAVCNNGQQCGGMSEGWGDFNGLLLQLREIDNRDGTYAQGSYADANGTPNAAYFSIRRFPYSRDRSKNPLSFRHIADENPIPTTAPSQPGGANSEVHNAGEIWALMMFEAFNTLIDEHGVPVGRRRITDYSVAGLLLTPPEATFTEGRDAILAAASALDTDDMILIAAAFAGRGAGSCAIAPSNAVRTNNGVVESGTLAGKLELGGLSLDPIKPGQSGLLHATIANGGPLAAEQVVVSASTSTTGVQIGAPISIPLLQPFSSADLTIPVKLLPTAPTGSNLVITVTAIGQQTCDPAGVSAVLTTPITQVAMTGAAASPILGESSIIATSQAPATSLEPADKQICIRDDTP